MCRTQPVLGLSWLAWNMTEGQSPFLALWPSIQKSLCYLQSSSRRLGITGAGAGLLLIPVFALGLPGPTCNALSGTHSYPCNLTGLCQLVQKHQHHIHRSGAGSRRSTYVPQHHEGSKTQAGCRSLNPKSCLCTDPRSLGIRAREEPKTSTGLPQAGLPLLQTVNVKSVFRFTCPVYEQMAEIMNLKLRLKTKLF